MAGGDGGHLDGTIGRSGWSDRDERVFRLPLGVLMAGLGLVSIAIHRDAVGAGALLVLIGSWSVLAFLRRARHR